MFCSACGARLPHHPPLACPSCATQHWHDSVPCAGALITNAGRLLLVRRAQDPWRDHWDVPGGFCDTREHPTDTAVREVVEETGLQVRITNLLGIWLDSYAPRFPGGPETITLNIYYHALLSGGHPRVDPHEVRELGWFRPDHLPEQLAFPGHIPEVLGAWREAYVASTA